MQRNEIRMSDADKVTQREQGKGGEVGAGGVWALNEAVRGDVES